MKILISPSGFKESIEPHVAADCIEQGILRACPDAQIYKAPLVDGGEGFVKALVAVTSGELIPLTVTGPIGEPVESHYGFLGGIDHPKTAVIEMAAAAGLRLVPKNYRDPSRTTTYGVGETIIAALDAGAQHILLGCGDSGTCDAGVGMVQALGARFIGSSEMILPLARGIQGLEELVDIDLSTVDQRLKTVKIDVACNWHNILCGVNGVARVFGPQKGATPSQVEAMSAAMDRCAEIMGKRLNRDIATAPGSGASGGLGAGLLCIGATLHPRFDIIMRYLNVEHLLRDCQLVFTAEGGLDYQTPRGKIPAEIARRAKKRNLPVIALAGTIGDNAQVNYDAGIDAFASIMQCPMSLDEAIEQAETLLIDSAEAAMRMVMVGNKIAEHQAYQPEPTVNLRFTSPRSTTLVRRYTSMARVSC